MTKGKSRENVIMHKKKVAPTFTTLSKIASLLISMQALGT